MGLLSLLQHINQSPEAYAKSQADKQAMEDADSWAEVKRGTSNDLYRDQHIQGLLSQMPLSDMEKQGMDSAGYERLRKNAGESFIEPTELERWSNQIDAMMASGNPNLQKIAYKQMQNYRDQRFKEEDGLSGTGQSDTSAIKNWKYGLANPDFAESQIADGPTRALDKYEKQAEAVGFKAGTEEYQNFIRERIASESTGGVDHRTWKQQIKSGDTALGYNDWLKEQDTIKANLAGKKRVAASEADIVSNFDSDMGTASNLVSNNEYTVDMIKEIIPDVGYGTAGIGSLLSVIPGTSAKDLLNAKEAIVSRISIDKLLEMKANSPSGASGFGALSESELKLLKSNLGSLEESSSPPKLKENLIKVIKQLEKINKNTRKRQRKLMSRYEQIAPQYSANPVDTSMYQWEGFSDQTGQPTTAPRAEPVSPVKQQREWKVGDGPVNGVFW